ncbi:MAG: hypothetical protein NTU60_05805 [Candidatus Aminicenantes bacterium]|nr:hypothetical protein [Candidatus Aminicenantes bacterium]
MCPRIFIHLMGPPAFSLPAENEDELQFGKCPVDFSGWIFLSAYLGREPLTRTTSLFDLHDTSTTPITTTPKTISFVFLTMTKNLRLSLRAVSAIASALLGLNSILDDGKVPIRVMLDGIKKITPDQDRIIPLRNVVPRPDVQKRQPEIIRVFSIGVEDVDQDALEGIISGGEGPDMIFVDEEPVDIIVIFGHFPGIPRVLLLIFRPPIGSAKYSGDLRLLKINPFDEILRGMNHIKIFLVIAVKTQARNIGIAGGRSPSAEFPNLKILLSRE